MFDAESVKKEYDSVIQELADPEVVSDWEKFQELSRQKTRLEGLLEKFTVLDDLSRQIAENESLISSNEDPDLVSLASTELAQLRERKAVLEKEISHVAGEEKKSSRRAAIIEIRPGVGGEESTLFVRDLFQMYSGLAKLERWSVEVLDSSDTDLGGLKEISFELKPGSGAEHGDVFDQMRWEAGVHRVQRIPQTEKSGRVHTSTATVAVLPRISTTEFKINPGDVKIEFFNATGPGGQNVNKRKTAVRLIHRPSGEVVTSRTERSQLQNKENALSVLAARLAEKQRQQQEERVMGERRAQIGTGLRAEKVRTYNFPQDRLTDHRVKKTWHNLEKILQGNLGPIIDELRKNHEAN